MIALLIGYVISEKASDCDFRRRQQVLVVGATEITRAVEEYGVARGHYPHNAQDLIASGQIKEWPNSPFSYSKKLKAISWDDIPQPGTFVYLPEPWNGEDSSSAAYGYRIFFFGPPNRRNKLGNLGPASPFPTEAIWYFVQDQPGFISSNVLTWKKDHYLTGYE